MSNKKQEEIWQERLNRFEQSGLSMSEYCCNASAGNGIGVLIDSLVA